VYDCGEPSRETASAAKRVVVQFAPRRPRRADRVDVGPRLQPLAEQDGSLGGRRDHDDVRPAHRLLGGWCGRETEALRERLGVSRAPDPDLAERADVSQRFQVASGLDSGAEDRQHRRVRAGEEPRRDRRHGAGPHLGDQSAIHDDERLAGLGLEEQDHGVVGGDALVVRVERHELRAERPGVGRHEAEEAPVLRDRQHHANRLHHVSARQSGQRTFHRRDEIFHTQQATDGLLGEDQEAHDAGIIVGGHACLQGVALSGATC